MKTSPVMIDIPTLWARAREHAAVLLHAAGALGDTVHRVHETVRETSGSLLVSLVAGLTAATGILKACIHRKGGTFNG